MSHDAAPPDPCGTLRGPMALPLEAEPPPDSDYLSLLKYCESFWKMGQIGSSLRLNKSISALGRLTSNKILHLHPNLTMYTSLNRLQLKKYASFTHYWSRRDSDINWTNSTQIYWDNLARWGLCLRAVESEFKSNSIFRCYPIFHPILSNFYPIFSRF